MNLRINLLKNEELRQAGVFTRAFIIRASIIGSITILVIVTAVLLLHVKSVKSDLLACRARFREIDTHYQDVRAMQNDLDSNKKLIQELGSWGNSRIIWRKSLMEFQKVVPPEIQLTRIDIRGALKVVSCESWENIAPTPARVFKFQLDGKVSGDTAYNIVDELVHAMKLSPGLENLFASVKLRGGLRRDGSRRSFGDSAARWVFGVEAEGVERKME